jgi:hypothetical protein
LPWKATDNVGEIIHYDFAIYRNALYAVTWPEDDEND